MELVSVLVIVGVLAAIALPRGADDHDCAGRRRLPRHGAQSGLHLPLRDSAAARQFTCDSRTGAIVLTNP